MRTGVVLAPALFVAVLLGCSDVMGAEQKVAEDPLAHAAPGIHPVLVVTGESGSEAVVELHLKRVKIASTVASFQGELVFDARALTLTGASVPGGITGAWNEVEKGHVRFAGVSLDGIGEGAVLALRLATQGKVDAGAFQLRFEELTATEGFQDLTPAIRQAEHPLLSRSPLP